MQQITRKFFFFFLFFIFFLKAQQLPEKYAKLTKEQALKFAKRINNGLNNFYKQRKYDEALKWAYIGLRLNEKYLPAEHMDIARSLNWIGNLLYSKGNYQEAVKFSKKALHIRETLLPSNHLEIANSVNNLAAILFKKGDYKESEAFYRRALQIRKQQLGENHPSTAGSISSLALLIQLKGDYKEAESLYRRVLKIYEKQLEPTHPYIATTLSNLASLIQTKGDYKRAETLFRRALQITETQFGPTHPEITTVLEHLAKTLMLKGDYEEAEPLIRRVIQINEKHLGETNPSIAGGIELLAELREIKGDYKEAESLYRHVIRIREKLLGPSHPSTANNLNSLAGLLHYKGNYEEAEPLYRRTLQIRKQQLEENHPSIANSVSNLALLLQEKGDYEKAELFYRQALKINEKKLGSTHPFTAISLNNLALFLKAKEDFKGAETLLRRALEINEKKLGSTHIDTATTLNNLALSLQAKKDYKNAEILLRRALEIYEKKLGSTHPEIANTLNNLALLLQAKGDYVGEEPLLRRALEIREKQLGPSHPYTALSLNNFALLLQAKGERKQAEEYLLKSFTGLSKHLKKEFPSLTERQQENFLKRNRIRIFINLYLSALTKEHTQNKLYNNLSIYKGISSRNIRMRNKQSIEPKAQKVFQELRKARTIYANLYMNSSKKLNPETQQKLLQKALFKKEDLEQKLYQLSKSFRQNDFLNNSSLKKVKEVLKAEDVVIDFLFYQHITSWKSLAKEERLIAFVIQKDSDVVRIEFGEALPLKSALNAFRQQLQNGQNRYTQNGQTVAQFLSERLLKPLKQYLKGKETLYIIPDGNLAFIPFEALPIKEEKKTLYLTEQKQIAYLFSPIDLVEYKYFNNEKTSGLLCLGDVAYNETPEIMEPQKTIARSNKLKNKTIWSPLLGTGKECEALIKTFTESHPDASYEYLNKIKASKSYVSTLAPEKKYIHLATHGFFKKTPTFKAEKHNLNSRGLGTLYDEEEEEEPQPLPLGITPMFFSGIVLAGANSNENNQGTDNGYLTAEELAGMNLQGCSLLTLSACETALGEKMDGQGVSGLRLAAQVAGVKSMLLSLWKVDDLGTQLFMQRFYEKLWKEKKGKLQALQETRLEWIQKQRAGNRGPQGQDIYNPSVWASFILSGQK